MHSNRHIEDLLSDENFIKWVKHPDDDSNLYWNTWVEAHPERKADVLLAKEMLIRAEFRHTTPSQEAFSEVLHRLLKKESSPAGLPPVQKKIKGKYWDFRVKVAASLAFLAFVAALITWKLHEPPISPQQSATPAYLIKQNPAGVKTQFQLPDGTLVWLNAESKVTYPETFDSISRQVALVGEAFFDVAKMNKGHLQYRQVIYILLR